LRADHSPKHWYWGHYCFWWSLHITCHTLVIWFLIFSLTLKWNNIPKKGTTLTKVLCLALERCHVKSSGFAQMWRVPLSVEERESLVKARVPLDGI
jgi:hypothetical protein